MAKYEIMLIIDPKSDLDNTHTLLKEVFQKELTSFEKMDRTELAYPINKQDHANYVLVHVNTKSPDNIKEFRRRVSISKDIWREMIINIDTEVGLGKKPKKFTGRIPFKRENREFKPRTKQSKETSNE